MIRPILVTVTALMAGYAVIFLACAFFAPTGQADIAVVFGSRVLGDGMPSRRLQARLHAALVAYQHRLVPRILVSGGRGASGYDEAAVMKEFLIKAGVPNGSVLVDSDGLNTDATVRNAMQVVHALGLTRIMVVTQYFHVPRCVLAFRQAGASAVVVTYPIFVEPRDLYSIGREMVALPVEAVWR